MLFFLQCFDKKKIPNNAKYKDLEIMFSYDFKSYCSGMPLFKSDVNWYYVSKIQLLDFYSHIHNYRVSEDNTESEKNETNSIKL